MTELVRLMDDTRKIGNEYEWGLLHNHWDWRYHGDHVSAEEAVAFAWAESDLYPKLGEYYKRVAARQCREWIREERERHRGKRRPDKQVL